jgi:hypothetical protein
MRALILAFCVVFTFGAPVAAQQGDPRPADERAQAPETPAPSERPQANTVNADGLGVSVDRIRLGFLRAEMFGDTFDAERLKLSTYVDVVAKAPPIQLFGPDAKRELTSHAVPFGPPTHRDMMALVTPQEFRTPPMDMFALMTWLADRFDKKRDE